MIEAVKGRVRADAAGTGPDLILLIFVHFNMIVVTRSRSGRWRPAKDQEPMLLLTPLNVLLTFLPRLVMAAAATATIRASITPYSTAVGPSSLDTKLRTHRNRFFMADTLSMGDPKKDRVLCGLAS